MAGVVLTLAVSLAVFAPQPAPRTEAAARPSTAPDVLPRGERDDAAARAAWDAGVQAFSEGRMTDAIVKFEATYRDSGRPGPLFSLGQAHRHRWEDERDPRQRQLAILRYQQYLELDPAGRRRVEAQRFIRELSYIDELEDLGDGPQIFTRLSLTSRTPGARVAIDGGPPTALPFTPDLPPGRHDVTFFADGFHAQHRAVELREGSTLPLEGDLEPLAARLTVRAPAAALLYIDGDRVARPPSSRPIAVQPGRRQVGVALRGHALYVRELELGRDEAHRIDVALERTGQRKVSLAAIAVGSSAITASAVLMGLAFAAQRDARAIEAEGSLDDERYAQAVRLQDRRDSMRNAAIATVVSGAVLTAAGIILYLVDRPPVGSMLHAPSRNASRRGRALAAIRRASVTAWRRP